MYQQTHHSPSEQPVSLLPLLTAQPEQPPAITHLILAAIHLNDSSAESTTVSPFLTLNDHTPTHPRFTQLWDEVLLLQDSGVKVMCMLGGAAQGSFTRLDYSAEELALLPPPSSVEAEASMAAPWPPPPPSSASTPRSAISCARTTSTASTSTSKNPPPCRASCT
ncbi:hypothetical protein GJ744_005055 [Endocarpon pusillum]|uniref:Chitinase n=1 Tax=Endocarpon pusillum TaxID=364733 RepID=A0A8H7AB41_9EURO|nr:hypothetical protein GJ744_005055 [Endocarpon pusillum]